METQLKVNGRDVEPLLLSRLCDRGMELQPENLIVTRTTTGYKTQTYAEHGRRARQFASALTKCGVRCEDRVATLMWNTGWHFECYHAISCMGAVLHTLNLRLCAADLEYIISHAQDRIIVADANLLKLLAEVGAAALDCVEVIICVGADGEPGQWTLPPALEARKAIDYDAFLETGSPDFKWPLLPETSTMGLCYTSGTTGRPKGVAYSQRSTYLHTLATNGPDQLGIAGRHVVLPFVPMFHVLSWGVPFNVLMTGCRAVFTSNFTDAGSMLQTMADWKVQLSCGVPTVWQGLRGEIEKAGVALWKPRLCLERLVCGGSAPAPEMMRWYLDHLGVEFIQVWGMTETNPLGSMTLRLPKVADLGKSLDDTFQNVVKAGLPVPGVEVRIASFDDLSKDAPRGHTGELLVRGPWVIQEYFQADAHDKFYQGWLITGDVAKIDEGGFIVISDRSKDVIKSGGEWISSIDMENALCGLSGVVAAAVVGVPHPRWDERPVAVVTLEPGAAQENLLERARQHLSSAFAKFQLPDDVLVWDAIPLTSTGKIDKKVIRARLQEQQYVVPTAQQSKL